MDNIYADTIAKALELLSPRQRYAAAVLLGKQRWSGADLCGKAKFYGVGYYLQRRKAEEALRRAGGEIIQIEHGKKVSAVLVRENADGSRIYETKYGTYRVPYYGGWAIRV